MRPPVPKRVRIVLFAICAALVVADFLYEKHGYLAIEDVPLFYVAFGFAASVVVLICASLLRFVVRRSDTYYAPADACADSHPEDQLSTGGDNV